MKKVLFFAIFALGSITSAFAKAGQANDEILFTGAILITLGLLALGLHLFDLIKKHHHNRHSIE